MMIFLNLRMLSVTCPNNAPDNSIQGELLEAFATDPLTLKGGLLTVTSTIWILQYLSSIL